MTSRRNFIRQAGLLAGTTFVPGLTAAASNVSRNINDIRRQLLVPEGRVYLNTGSLGPSPRFVIEAVTEAMWTLERNPVSENWGPLGSAMEQVRGKVASFINADADSILLTRNTTEGLSLVCQNLPLNGGDEIITTTLEHGGGEVGLDYLVKTRGARLLKVELPLPPNDPQEIVQVIARAITPRTRLLMLSHVNTVTGMLMPVAEISKLTSGRGIYLLIDGAQAPGLTRVDVKAMGCDAYACSGHKWLLGPKETGFLYVRNGFPSSVPPLFALSGMQAYSASSGTRNVATLIGLGAAMDWHQALDIDKTAAYTLELRNYCMTGLRNIQGLRILSPDHPTLSTGIVSFELLKGKNSDVYARMKERNIIVKVLPQHNAIRISCHIFVSREDIDTFLVALKEMV